MTEKEAFERKTKHPEQIDFKLLILRYARYWYLFALGAVLALLLAILYLSFATPKYLISSSIKIRGVDRDPDYQAGSPGFRRLDVYDEAASMEDEIEALRALSLMERVMQELEMTTSYHVPAGLREREVYGQELPVLVTVDTLHQDAFGEKISIRVNNAESFTLLDETGDAAVYSFGQTVRRPYGSFTVAATPQLTQWNTATDIRINFHNTRALAIDYNKEITVVQLGEESSIVSISLLHPVPEKGKLILNKMVELYNREAREDRNRLAMNTIHFIDERLKTLTADLSGVERDVEQFRRENQVTDPRSDASAYLEESRVYDRQLSDLNIQIGVLESLDRYLSQRREQYELVPSNLTIEDPTLLNLINRFNELQLERERKLRNVEPSNPLLLNLNEQLANLRLNILENLRVIRSGLLVKRNNVSQKASGFRARIEGAPGIERELNEINRQLGVKQDLYNFLLQKREESALSLAATTSNTRLIDPAIASKAPVEPNKPVVLLMALVLGLLLPFAGIFVKDFLDNSVQLRKDVEKLSAAPVMGEVPHIARKQNWVAMQQHNTLLSQQMGLILSNLQAETPGAENKVLLVTSGRNGEGKTFFSKNLALSLSLTGKKVVLVELDLRNPSLAQEFGLSDTGGIAAYLQAEGRFSPDEILEPSGVAPNLFVVGAGAAPLNPAAAFGNPRLGQLLETLRKNFDYVVIDTAPVGQVADAFALAPFTDLTVYVVRYNYTLKAALNTIDALYEKKKLKQPVIVLNAARKMNSHSIR